MAAIDIVNLWDFSNPELSEQRFREALKTANHNNFFVLQTQIARSYGLRRQFKQAQAILEDLRPAIEVVGAEARTHYFLEYGRTLVSATHKDDEISSEERNQAREAYIKAMQFAHEAQLDYLTIDALHMLAFVETDGQNQLEWTKHALDIIAASSQPETRRWEMTLRNNMACALHQMGRYAEALPLFQSNIPLAEQQGNAEKLRIAHWMVAWTLRSMDRIDEAIAIQLELEQACDAANTPDPFVFEELSLLYKLKNDLNKMEHYAALFQAT